MQLLYRCLASKQGEITFWTLLIILLHLMA